MHFTAMSSGKMFFQTYCQNANADSGLNIVEIGSQTVTDGLRQLAPENAIYTGVDFVEAPGVDVILSDPYELPFEDESFDVAVSSSCFEHSEFFWLTFIETLRVLKPHGLFYLNVPSNGEFHRYPVDCWRFYPDSGKALVKWANRNSIRCALLESFTTRQVKDIWNDYVCVFIKDEGFVHQYPSRMINNRNDFKNATIYGSEEIINKRARTEDQKFSSLFFKLLRRLRRAPNT